jgi:hypothetical protein
MKDFLFLFIFFFAAKEEKNLNVLELIYQETSVAAV